MGERRSFLLGCSFVVLSAAATEAAAAEVCPHGELAPNPWFTCLDAAPAAGGGDAAVVVGEDGSIHIDGAGHVVGVFAEGPGGRVTVDGAGEVEIQTGGPGALGVALVGGSSVAALGPAAVIAAPGEDPASVWLEQPEVAEGERLLVFGGAGSLQLGPDAPAGGANMLGLGAVSTPGGFAAESVYFGPDAEPKDTGRSISVHGAAGVGVELAPALVEPPSGPYGYEAVERSWDGAPRRHAVDATPAHERSSGQATVQKPTQGLVTGASLDVAAPADAEAEVVATPSAAAPADALTALAVARGAQAFWYGSADAWSARGRALRDKPEGEGGRVWSEAHGGAETQDLGAGPQLKASWRGVQTGVERGSARDGRSLWWGATAGFTDYDADLGAEAFELRGLNLGVYAGGTWGGLYAQALVKADAVEVEAAFGALSRRNFDGVSWGAQGEVGYRFGSARLFLEPAAALAWVKAELDGFSEGGTAAAYDSAVSLRGRTGVRLGGRATLGKTVVVPYVGVHVAAEFDGENRMRFTDGGTFALVDEGRGSWGEAEVGVSGATWFGLETFAEAKASSGGDVRGWGARLGARWRW